MRGRHLIGFSNANREVTSVNVGDLVEIELLVDGTPQTAIVPEDLQNAFAERPTEGERFTKLTVSQQKQHIRLIEQAKTKETRSRRIASLLAGLGQ
jgi:hypothetical protein